MCWIFEEVIYRDVIKKNIEVRMLEWVIKNPKKGSRIPKVKRKRYLRNRPKGLFDEKALEKGR